MITAKKDLIKVAIDPGHGGKDRSNRGPSGYIEADGVLQEALLLEQELLSTSAFEVKLTRRTDKTLSLTERGKIAVAFHADLFLIQHTNATDKAVNMTISGSTVYTSVDLQDDELGAKMSKAIAGALDVPDRGVKHRESEKYPGEDYYTVMDVAQDGGVPHILLCEDAFHDNPSDEEKLKQYDYLLKAAKAKAQVICDFYGVKYPVMKANDYKYTGGIDITNLPILRYSSSGEKVRMLQRELNEAGFACGNVDGSFGAKTDKAVRLYQDVCGISIDGVVGMETWTALLGVDVVELDPGMLKAALVSASGPVVAKTYKNFVNSNFFGKGVIGWLISEGSILSRRDEYKVWKGNVKGTFIVYEDGRVEVGWKLDSEIAPVAGQIRFCCQGFNLFPLDIKKEGFSASVGRTCNSIHIGFNKSSGKAIIAARPATNAARAVKTMEALGCKGVAVRLDSGSTANLHVNGKAIYTTNNRLTNIVHW